MTEKARDTLRSLIFDEVCDVHLGNETTQTVTTNILNIIESITSGDALGFTIVEPSDFDRQDAPESVQNYLHQLEVIIGHMAPGAMIDIIEYDDE